MRGSYDKRKMIVRSFVNALPNFCLASRKKTVLRTYANVWIDVKPTTLILLTEGAAQKLF